MRKSTKIVKRIFALLLVVLMSIESFAAVVSDNDGSAFITKAEFDSMKNDFQSQIDQYNTSIDNKIDGAISAYLAGINLAKTSTKDLIYKSWKEYKITSTAFTNTFEVPKIDANFIWLHWKNFDANAATAVVGHQYHLTGAVHANLNNPTCIGMKKNVVSCYKKNTSEPGVEARGLDISQNDFVWRGRASDWKEDVKLGKRIYTSADISGAGGLKVWFLNAFTFTITDGYQTDALSVNNVWKPLFRFTKNNTGNTLGSLTSTDDWGNISWTCSVNTYTDEQIGTFNSDTSWEVSNPNWENTFKTSASTTCTSKSIYNGTITSSRGLFAKDVMNKASSGNNSGYETWEPGTISAGFLNSTSQLNPNTKEDKTPSIGLLGNLLSSDIFQTLEDIKTTDEKNAEKKHDRITLQSGYPLFYASAGTKVQWKPIFKTVSGTGLASNEEVNIVLAYEKFSDGITCNNKYITYKDASGTEKSVWTTSGRTARVSFEMPTDGFVFAKWWPSSLTSDAAKTAKWEITLDNANCNTATFEVSE